MSKLNRIITSILPGIFLIGHNFYLADVSSRTIANLLINKSSKNRKPIKGTMKNLTIIFFISTFLWMLGCNPSKEKKDVIEPSIAEQVLSRFIGDRAKEITFRALHDDIENPGKMVFEIEAKNGKVTIGGNSGVARCRGAYTYLKEACSSMITWGGQHIEIPEKWPDYVKKRVICPYKYTLQDNVCAFGYTNPYSTWKDWQRYIDVMALHGYNMMYAPIGSEAIWMRVWKNMGFSEKDVLDFFTGPAYLPWHRMGNINKYDGPIPNGFFPQTIELQKEILAQMRALGMHPIAPTFAGFVPESFETKFPDSEIRHVNSWNEFNPPYTTHILHPLSPYFQEIGKNFITEWEKEFGKSDFFFADAFNELKPPVTGNTEGKKQEELAQFGKSIYNSINSIKPNATWVMQGWLFSWEKFWNKERAKALLSKIPNDKMLVLDLYAEHFPMWEEYEQFFGKNWMLSIIPNWGGTMHLGGPLEKYKELITETVKRKNTEKLTGFGYSPEGTENNEVVYELASDAAWATTDFDLNQWLANYCKSRYGTTDPELVKAWQLLAREVYNREVKHPVSLFQSRPDGTSIPFGVAYKVDVDLEKALHLLLNHTKDIENNELFMNDLIEIADYHLAAIADNHIKNLKRLVAQKDFEKADKEMEEVKKYVLTIDELLSMHTIHNMDRWVQKARKWGTSKEEEDYYESNAKRIVTVWGTVLSEYGGRLWSGLVSKYYLARWEAWYAAKKEGKAFDGKDWEQNWINNTENYHSEKTYDNALESLKNKIN